MPVATRGSDQFNLRLPDEMRSRIAALAKANQRSMNSEIVFRLARVLDAEVEAATGNSFQASPAAVPNETALQGGPITHGVGGRR